MMMLNKLYYGGVISTSLSGRVPHHQDAQFRSSSPLKIVVMSPILGRSSLGLPNSRQRQQGVRNKWRTVRSTPFPTENHATESFLHRQTISD